MWAMSAPELEYYDLRKQYVAPTLQLPLVNSEHIYLMINNKSWSSTIQGLSKSYNLNILSAS